MKHVFRTIPPGSITLSASIFQERFFLNRKYLLSLRTENLLQNYYLEAGIWAPYYLPKDMHLGWETPTCQLRGHFLGHWLSAAMQVYAHNKDTEMKGKADYIISELARCQKENGGEWVGSIPEKYFDWIARGKRVWAPHYTVHKLLMGLFDAFKFGGNNQALEILIKWARWFYRWSAQFSKEQMNDILDVETGGMLEVWANLYGITNEKEHLELLKRYDRPRLFEPLILGKDVLTNQHANTTIPEIHGAARAWEVTNQKRWRDIVKNYWRMAVTDRGYFCTGGQTNGEGWTPPFKLSARLGDTTQEHCSVYNMMRLAEYLLHWTGDVSYLDYWERNLYNGILAQQHPDDGRIAYFLPLCAGSFKKWGTETEDFWCCHGTLVQAHSIYFSNIYFEDDEGLVLGQYIPSELSWVFNDIPIKITLQMDKQLESVHRPHSLVFYLAINCERPCRFNIKIRLPWWLDKKPDININGQRQNVPFKPSSYFSLTRTWKNDKIHINLPRGLSTCPLPDEPDTVAFMDGPVVLAGIYNQKIQTVVPRTPHPRSGICGDEILLTGNKKKPATLLIPDNEREWSQWLSGYRTKNQSRNIHFIPLYEVRDEPYAVYFPVQPDKNRT